MNERILGIDYGEARTGVAVTDALGLLAVGVGTIEERDLNRLINRICDIAKEKSVTKIVLGDPVNMNGSVGEKSEKIARIAARIAEQSGIPVVLFDERCTTMAAHTILNATDTRGKKRKKIVDTLSAEIILQNFMDSEKAKRSSENEKSRA